jgi:RNA polymerase sigma-70 factor (ECF subfamily)
MNGVHDEVERAARQSARRLIAYLAASSHDVAAAEDALSDAFTSALRSWPQTGVPQNPEAWLLTAARRRLVDAARHRRVRDAKSALLAAADEGIDTLDAGVPIPDRRLALMFVCAHPAIAREVRTPLMLQVVLGVDVARMASAFLLKLATLGQRLSRAKAKLRDAGIAFEIPGQRDMQGRLMPVLEAIYAAFGTGWDDIARTSEVTRGLTAEAIELGETLCDLLPAEPEAKGLLALMLFCEARRPARRDAKGCFVPLAAQCPSQWNEPMMARAGHLLTQAAGQGRMGRFQLEAAIQSVHAHRRHTGMTDWSAIALLYEGLLAGRPTLAHRLGHAAALAHLQGPEAALALIDGIPNDVVSEHQPNWALRGDLLLQVGRADEAGAALRRAAALAPDDATRSYPVGRVR